jgi:hypothetical protein
MVTPNIIFHKQGDHIFFKENPGHSLKMEGVREGAHLHDEN